MKDELRVELRAQRRALTTEQRIAADAVITAAVLNDESVITAKCVHVYLSTKFEVSTAEIIRTLMSRGVMIVVPWMLPDGSMGATRLELSDLDGIDQTGPRGVPCAPALREVDTSLVDVVLVPLVGADRAGHRLGMGAGHYDRFLAAHPRATSIGLAFACQLVDQLPTELHDIALTRILTE